MKKLLICLLVMAIMTCLFCACADSQNSFVTTTHTHTATTTMANVTLGGSSFEYSYHFSLDFGIESAVSSLLDEEEYRAWCNTFEHYDKGGTRSKYEYNLYNLIREFSIPREKIEAICSWYKELFPDDEYLSEEQLDMLYNGEEVEVYQYFANPYAVVVEKEVYPPKWMVEHTAEEYAAEGITYAIMSEKMDRMLSVCNEEQQDHLRTQLAALKELEE